MDNTLEERIRYHSYSPNPAVDEYLEMRRRSHTDLEHLSEQTTVRERHISGVSVGEDEVDCHERCMTPVAYPQQRHDLNCVICHSLAINPFRCAPIEERDGVLADNQSDRAQVYHICCYQCLCINMLTKGTDHFDCPYCHINEFNFNKLLFVDRQVIKDAEIYLIHCPNNCGLMGSPLALANHSCVLQDGKLPGHSPLSNIVPNLRSANTSLNAENCELRNELTNSKSATNYWRSEFYDLQELHRREQVLSELINNINKNLRRRIDEKDAIIERLKNVKKDTIKQCKQTLKRVDKHYKTKIQEMEEINERLSKELKDLLDMNTSSDSASFQRRVRSGSSSAESSDEHTLGFPSLFASPSPTPNADNQILEVMDSSSDEETIPSNEF